MGPAHISEEPDAEQASRASDGLLTLTRDMQSDEDEQFDVDLTILDFLTYKAMELVFASRSSAGAHRPDPPSALLIMTAEWRTLLHHKHGGRPLRHPAALRSRLLQFVLLFSHRLEHREPWTTEESLDDLRAQNRDRGSWWRAHSAHAPALQQPFDPWSEFPLSDSVLADNRTKLACSLGQPLGQRGWVTDVPGTPSLHCLLPLFVELTAARARLGDWVPTETWMDLVGRFMLQAVLDEYLLNGASGADPFNTIFAFGCPGASPRPDEGTHVQAMRSLFCVQGNTCQQLNVWTRIKRAYINELLPEEGSSTSFLQAMQSAQDRFPYADFEDSVLLFLKSMHTDLVKPDLVQVEHGRITIHGNELTESESREMIHRMGL